MADVVTDFSQVDFTLSFLILVVVVGLLLLAGAYVNFTRGRMTLALLCAGVLMMLISPLLGVIVLVAAALILAMQGDYRDAFMALIFVVVSYIAAAVLATVVVTISAVVGLI